MLECRAAVRWLILFLVEYNEDLDFTMDDLTSPYYGCSMMLNGEYFILRLEQVKYFYSI